MNLFVKYSKEEIEYLLSIVNNDFGFKNPLFKGLLKNEIEEICKYISIENLPDKKVIENYDLIYLINGCVVEVKNKKIIKKYYENSLIGIKSRFLKEEKQSLITLQKSRLIFFDIKDIHNELTSKFYKNLSFYLLSNFSNID